MPGGLVIRDTSANIVIGITDRLTRQLGTIQVGAPGSLAVPEAAGGTPWVMTIDPNRGVSNFTQPMIPRWQGTTLIWEAKQFGVPYRTTFLIYGLY